MDTRGASTEDSVTYAREFDRPGRFIRSDDRLMRARISHYDPGIPIAAWSASVDQAVWTVVER